MKKLNFIALCGALILSLPSGVVQATVNPITVKDININTSQTGHFDHGSFQVNAPLLMGDVVEFQDNSSRSGSFPGRVIFSLAGLSAGQEFLTAFRAIAGMDLNIIGGTDESLYPNARAYTFSGFTSGVTYSLIASGRGLGAHPAVAGPLQVLSVPESEEWAMLVLSISLIAFQVRRKHKALGRGHGIISGH